MGLLNRLRRRETPIDPRDDLWDYWRSRTPDSEHNRIDDYTLRVGRSEALATLIADVPKDGRILEVGCNVGRNLAYLFDQGWTQVKGVEINPNSVDFLRQHYTQLADRPIHLGPAEEVLLGLDGPYDLVFTMAVIEHIHPDSTVVFDNIARLGRSVLAVEPKGNATHRQYPHDVVALFTSRGMTLRSTTPMRDLPGTKDDRWLGHFFAWRFDR